MALTYSWKQLVERIQINILNDFPSSESTMTDNQVLLYINEAMSMGIVGQVYGGAKILGTLEMPDAYIVRFQLAALTKDTPTGYWTTTLPQPPLSLPLGYSINRIYFANAVDGVGQDINLIKAKRVGRRADMPLQFGVRAWVTGTKLWLAASNGTSLLNQDCYIEMPSTRAVNITDPMPLPDDAIEAIFTKVTARLKERLQFPQENIQDDSPAGNKGH
jgi:hypothetical protein